MIIMNKKCNITLNQRGVQMKPTKRIVAITLIILIACLLMGIVDAWIQPDYFVKSVIKISLFLALPILYIACSKDSDLLAFLKPNAKGLRAALVLGVCVYGVVVAAYALFKDVFDFSGITSSLTGDIGVTKDNFVFVALYISFVNSFLEEFFFRGFAFLTLLQLTSRKFAYFFSAGVFALYHIAMMIGWFSLSLFLITMVALVISGLLFNYLNEKHHNIYTSWIVHMFGNFGINTIGFILFGII